MRRKIRQTLHNIRVYFIKRMSRIPRYIMFGISGAFFIGIVLHLFGVNAMSGDWQLYQMVLVMVTSFVTGMSLYLSAPNPKTDPY